ncbi:fibronectin type III domain-containing protein [Corallococcus macrosporus DSM 14697]|uniref:Fibronectin type III domain-containing protein n=2 Tax=Corallococcus macrosporus TaxID=35 RepID=A0A250K005_9BACT|nr:fibronectin type III domain-containing protein [Corallococcus macrosporus DSM 14697]
MPSRFAWVLGLALQVSLSACGPQEASVERMLPGPQEALTQRVPGTLPDLMVRRLSLQPAARVGDDFHVAVEVCNRMPFSAGPFVAEVRLSQDRDFTSTDPTLFLRAVDGLEASACELVQGWVRVDAALAGAHFVAAVVDADGQVEESDEANNQFQGGTLGVGRGPDFVITALRAPAVVDDLQRPIVATATVCNRGTLAANGAIDLLLSADAVVTADDRVETWTDGFFLDPNACQDLELHVRPPGPALRYHVGALVDAYPGAPADLVPGNNLWVGGQLAYADQPDLIVTQVEVPSSVTGTLPFQAEVMVCNQGTRPTPTWFEVTLLLSAQPIVVAEERSIGYALVSPLEAGQCARARVEASVPGVASGAWYVSAVANAHRARVEEAFWDNNVGPSTRLLVGEAPDFRVVAMEAPGALAPWEPRTARVTVCNEGTAGAPVDVGLYWSSDEELILPEPIAGSLGFGFLAPGQCATESVSIFTLEPLSGARYLMASADVGERWAELDETNNTFIGRRVFMGLGHDLAVTSLEAPASVHDLSQFLVRVTVCNQGNVSSPDGNLEIRYRVVRTGPWAGTLAFPFLPSIAPGACVRRDVPVQLLFERPYGLFLDARVWTSDVFEDNDISSPLVPLGVGDRPDFKVTSVVAPAGVSPGQGFSTDVTVCNQGLRDASTDVMVVLSQDEEISTRDLFAGWAETGLVQAGQCVALKVPSHAGSLWPGVFTVGAVVDPYADSYWNNELREDNNTLAGGQVSLGRVADFAVTAVSAPNAVAPGAVFTAKVTVCNQGAARGSTDVVLVLSRTSRISLAELPLGGMPVGTLERGQCATREVSLTAPSTPTQGVLGALVDSLDVAQEPREDNNALAGGHLSVGAGPDLTVDIVEMPSIQPANVRFITQVRVCNAGTLPAPGEARVYLSADAVIDPVVDTPQGGLYFDVLAPGQCQVVHIPVNFYQPAWTLPEGRWHWGAVAFPIGGEPELHWDDNVDARPLSVGQVPDFSVTALDVPASVLPDQPFTAKATVCNAGTAAGATAVRLVRDWSPFYAPAAHTLAEAMTEPLSPGQCTSLNMRASAGVSFEGRYTVSAVANPDGATAELREDDNVRTAHLGVGALPDFTVGSVQLPRALARSAEVVTAAVQVCNVGTVAGEVELALVVSEDATITAADMPLSAVPVGPLSAGTCTTADVPASLWVPSNGAWFVGAVVDSYGAVSELRRDNNASVGVPVGIGGLPDFVVTRLSAPPSVAPGAALPTVVEVCNVGAVASDVDVSFYLSADDRVTPEDTQLQTWSYGSLGVGNCTSVEVSLATSPLVQMGVVRHIGAIADAGRTRAELSETNNVSPVVPLSILSGPDLVIRSVDAPPGVAPGASFQVTALVCNQGTGDSDHARATGYFARVGAGALRGAPAWQYQVPPLSPGRCATLENTLTAGQEAGLWFLSSEVGPISSSTDMVPDNNAGPVAPVRVGHLPDFVVASVHAPTAVRPADAFQVDVTVCNPGTAEGQSDMTVFVSRDSSPSVEDLYLGPVPTGALGQGQCATLPVTVPRDAQRSGSWFVGALVDRSAQVAELSETNNTHAGVPVRFASLPDFVVTSVVAPTSVLIGDTFPAQVTVCNQGTATGNVLLSLHLSPDAVISIQDVLGGGPELVTGLAPGACSLVEVPVQARASQAGLWYLGAVVDARLWGEEASTVNNTSVGRLVGIGFRPDLVITEVAAPEVAPQGQPLPVTVTVCNQGTTSVSNAALGFSVNWLPEVWQDLRFATVASVALAAGACERVAVSVPLSGFESAWPATYVVASVDPSGVVQEFNEHNNERASLPVSVRVDLADLVTEAVRAPSTVKPGQPFTGTVRVCNEGFGPAPARVALHASRDARVTSEDLLLGEASLGTLAPGQCAEHAIPAVLQASGTFFLAAISSTGGAAYEIDETNNVGPALQVYAESTGTDFVMESAVVPSIVLPDAAFNASVRVCNRGGLGGEAAVSLYLSPDALVDPTDTVLDSRAGLSLPAGQCVSLSLQGAVPQPGRWYVAAIADPLEAQPEDDEANNSSPVSALVVGEVPDYVIAALTAPPVETSNGPLPVRITVCNQGTAPAQATGVRFQLRAAGPTTDGGLRVASRSVPALAAAQCVAWEEPLGLVAVAPRAWRLEASVNPDAVVTEAYLDNNVKAAEVRVGNHAELSVAHIAPERNALFPSETFVTEVTVCNTGSVTASELRVQVLLSEDGLDPDAGTQVGMRSFAGLAKGCAVIPVTGTVPSQALGGEVHVKARVELVAPQGGELNVDDNGLVGPLVGIGSGPDLVVTTVTTDVSVSWPSAPLPAVVTVCNRGDEYSLRASLSVFPMWEEDGEFVPDTSEGASVSVYPLAPGECDALHVELMTPPVEGDWRLGAMVDGVNAVRETVESNNLSHGDAFFVTRVTGHAVTALQAPTAVWPNEFFTATATVCNRGPTTSWGMPIHLALETEDGFPVTTLPVRASPSNLATGACAPVTLSGSAAVPLEGAYRLVARLGHPKEPMAEALRRALSFAVPLVVGGRGDFTVTAVSGPATVRTGGSYSTSVTVCNHGTSSGAATVQAYLSRDERLDVAGDVRVGQTSVTLSRNQCRTLSVSSRANSVSSGDVWFVGADVSMGNSPDANPANDGRVGARILVTP